MYHSDTHCPYCGGLTDEGYEELVCPSGGSADEWIESESYLRERGVDLTRCSCPPVQGPMEQSLWSLIQGH